MAVHEFDAAAFRLLFPAFANPVTYPDGTLQGWWNVAVQYINASDYKTLCGDRLQLALNQMTAHLLALSAIVAAGQVPGVETSATIDKISVTLQAPPAPNQWQWWLNQSPYGQQLLALLQVAIAGGFFVPGGAPERSAFRKAYGRF